MSEAHTLRTGVAQGGPLAGREFTVRKPEGILAVNRETNEASIYDWDAEESVFTLRVQEDLNHDKRLKAAAEWRYEVIPYE